ncbi:YecA family protein [Psychrobacillus vulpis]|uniref:Metal-binding protein n=1 Tax=Psychrobacillus vulpis TaxID=2325572 RepID=A0A544TSC7_9BACI|nr:SEC-C metal-binding domain-containing protein [Psychrobacillus vulpis]TQR20351.1 metal-binding protein [Psychrobacillus vulpis]
MVGRNDPCPCGSGKKYKKCCESKEAITIEEVQTEELERILQTFYDEYPERKDVSKFAELVKSWSASLSNYLEHEMVEAIALDEFFFHHEPEIWTGYLDKQEKRIVRPSILKVLKEWRNPRVFVGEVVGIDDTYMKVTHILSNETIQLRRESDKPVPVGVHLFCFILPDGSDRENHNLAISSLIFFPTDQNEVFKNFVKQFESQSELSAQTYLKENGKTLWSLLGENGYEGGEYTHFEAGVLQVAIDFLEKNNRDYEKLLEIVEDYLVEQQPNARKEVAIAAGAIRFGQENGLFEPLEITIKEIAEEFNVSTSSLNKYYHDLNNYYERIKETK